MKKWLSLFEQPYNPNEDPEAAENARDEANRQLEQKVKAFCEAELGWEMDGGYSVILEDETTLSISPNEIECTLEQLTKLAVLGEVSINAAARSGMITIGVRMHPGLSIS